MRDLRDDCILKTYSIDRSSELSSSCYRAGSVDRPSMLFMTVQVTYFSPPLLQPGLGRMPIRVNSLAFCLNGCVHCAGWPFYLQLKPRPLTAVLYLLNPGSRRSAPSG